ncbi:MAG: hypothetical protein Q7U98_20285 [Methylicorpusculum sp.]|uniref:hypothetical protein n=1 Tax=Methylicorpusculum sp. TaxID=2713644 RepID=UPI00271ACFFF|nr:hypothetical protein [Methylicorpusculum sp.]MDO8941504.1 hypothetical protein [Methylicorpusculum sp.]
MKSLSDNLHEQFQQRRVDELQNHLTRYSILIDNQYNEMRKQRWKVRIAYGLAAVLLISLMAVSRHYSQLPVLRLVGMECRP